MRRTRFSVGLAMLALIGLLPGPALYAADTKLPAARAAATPIIRDVALGADGTLLGMVVDSQGVPLPKLPVIVRQSTREIARTESGADGRFQVKGLTGGVYDVTAGPGVGTFRLWAANTAPPSANSGVLLVAQADAVRGQMPLENFLTSDVVIITLIGAAAIAIPVAIHNSRNDKKSGS